MNRLAAIIVAVGLVQTEPRRGFKAQFAEAGLDSKQ